MCIHTRTYLYIYCHPEVDRIWLFLGIYSGSFKDYILSTAGWLYMYLYMYMYIYMYMHMCMFVKGPLQEDGSGGSRVCPVQSIGFLT